MMTHIIKQCNILVLSYHFLHFELYFRETPDEIEVKSFSVGRHVKDRMKEFHRPKTPEELYAEDRKKGSCKVQT